MITEVITQDGKRISAEEAVLLQDVAKSKGENLSIYIDPLTGDTIIKPRHGHKTMLSHARDHFYHPSEIIEKGIGKERRNAVKSLESILDSDNDFDEFKKGVLCFHDAKNAVMFDINPDFDYGFNVLWAKKADGKEYALLVLNRVPNSSDYLNLLKSMCNKERFEGDLELKKYLVEENGEKTILGDTIYLATIQMKNRYLFRSNKEENHPKNFIMLGDWQTKHLSSLYQDFVYFNMETQLLEVVNLESFSHKCSYSYYRHLFKDNPLPEHGSKFCQSATPKYEGIKRLTLEPFEIEKDSLKDKIGEHPRLCLAKFVPLQQFGLFDQAKNN